ncbi:BZ3500_MvSof-1268-A1-R1_Chr12-2g03855 [Microbotryum saponariae]|uniref:BZ3500_MvSof-1268-A1-R1_Chr12-2g03855 protein n=1 Tax=Microbotryum saponariae TaxID=289078 RepID=A0A2X0MPN3_9BASI|nr:BZ3500_MvSof-1268-A1-R1_Chr12-2g03855 [Microbotryum saponariae]
MTRRLARIAAVRQIYSLGFGFTSSHYVNTSNQYLSWYFSPSTQHDGVHNHRPKLFNSNWTQLKRLTSLPGCRSTWWTGERCWDLAAA